MSGWMTEFASMVAMTSVARAYFGDVPPANRERRFVLGPSFTLGDG